MAIGRGRLHSAAPVGCRTGRSQSRCDCRRHHASSPGGSARHFNHSDRYGDRCRPSRIRRSRQSFAARWKYHRAIDHAGRAQRQTAPTAQGRSATGCPGRRAMESTHGVSCEGAREPQGGCAFVGDRTQPRERANVRGDRSSVRGCGPSARRGALRGGLPAFLYAQSGNREACDEGSDARHLGREAIH